MNTFLLRITLLFTGILLAPAPARAIEVLTYLRPNRSIEISSTQNGVIREILVEPGQEVEEGQVLLKLDSAVIEAQLAQAQAQAAHQGKIDAAEAEYQLAKQRFEIITSLSERGSANSAELDKGRATLLVAEGQLNTAREEQEILRFQVKRIEAELERRILRSPIGGTVTEVVKDVAESVTTTHPGETSHLIRILDLNQLRAKAHVPYQHCDGLHLEDTILLTLQNAARTEAEGRIVYISPVVDPATRTREVHLRFDNRDRRLTAGIPAHLLIPEQRP